MELNARHVAADTIFPGARIRVNRRSGVASRAPGIVIGRIVTNGVVMGRVAIGACQLAILKAAAFHQAQRLKPNIFERRFVCGRLHAMTRAAKPDLFQRRHLAWV